MAEKQRKLHAIMIQLPHQLYIMPIYMCVYIYIFRKTQRKSKRKMADQQRKPHAIMISVPYQGHINPFVNLALKIASKGFTITFVHLEFVHHKLSEIYHENTSEVDLFSGARESGLDIHYMTISDGFPLEFDRDLHFPEYWNYLARDFPARVDEFVGKIIRSDPFSVFFLVIDTIYWWPATIAEKHNLVNVSFWTQPALVFSLGYHWKVLKEKGHVPCKARVDEFVGKTMQSDPFSVYFLVMDVIYWWPATIAKKYNIVNVSFWTTPAMLFCLAYHWKVLIEKGHIPCKDNTKVQIDYIPGVQSISTWNLMSFLTEADSIVGEALSAAFQEVKKADFILHNTVYELESETLSTLNKYQPSYAIGPINFFKNLGTNTISTSLWSESNCTHWLDSKPPGSVLYVSFGSLIQTNKQVIEEIAYELLLSEVNLIWVVREGIVNLSDTNILPAGYEDEVKDKGLIISWCDQIKVLSNPAVRGFLMHNGWNSIVESMWFGVPMICYPITYDQLTNRKLVVDNWKIGINLCDGACVDRKEVAEKTRDFMSNGTTYNNLRLEANKVKEILHNALEIDGSSERNFNQFIKDLKIKIHGTSISE